MSVSRETKFGHLYLKDSDLTLDNVTTRDHMKKIKEINLRTCYGRVGHSNQIRPDLTGSTNSQCYLLVNSKERKTEPTL